MRRFFPSVGFAAAILFSSSFSASAQTEPSKTTPLESRATGQKIIAQLLREGKIMRPSEAKRGMKGYGLSVFQGTKIEKFPVEIIGTLEKAMGGGDLVLIRVTGGTVVQRKSGIIAGMSGSPVYFNGKMLGAIAIGFGFPKEPIGGVTPVTQMIETSLPDNVPPQPTVKIARHLAPDETYKPREPLQIAGRNIEKVVVSRDLNRLALSGSTMTMRPATQLLQLSGISSASLPRLKKMFAPYGLEPVIGGGKMSNRQVFGMPSQESGVNPPFTPGGAIGVQLVSGDIDMTGVGTVTFRWGNRVLAFGHPMLGLGAVSMPMTTAYIHDIFPAYSTSFKLGSPVKTIGSLQQDNEFAIGGTVGRMAEMVPMRVFIRDNKRHINKTFSTKIFKDPVFTPQLATSVAIESMISTLGMDSNKMLRIGMRMQFKNAPPIYRQNYVYASDLVIIEPLMQMIDAIMLTQANSFEKGALKSIDLSIAVEQGRQTARIRRIFADRNKVKAGETVQLTAVIEPTGHPEKSFNRQFSFEVPKDARDGLLRIVASNGEDYWMARSRVGAAPPRPANLNQLVNDYRKVGSANELLVQASTPDEFLLVDRVKVADPPPSWGKLVPPNPSTSIGLYNEVQERREGSQFALSGMEMVVLPVESARRSDREKPDTAKNNTGGTDPLAVSSNEVIESDFTPEMPEPELPEPVEPADIEEMAALGQNIKAFRRRIAQLKTTVTTTTTTTTGAPDATPTPTATPTSTPTPTPTPDPKANAIARPAGQWIQDSAADFARGTFEGATVSDNGRVTSAPASKPVASTGEPVAWSIAGDLAGNIYLGTGNSAKLFKIAPNGQKTVLYAGNEVAVTALATDKTGNLYAGVSPGGRVLRFAPDGTRQTILETNQVFVWALEWDAQNRLLASTGGASGAIYRIENPAQIERADFKIQPLARVPQKHIRALAVRGDEIFAGTSEDAILYQIDATSGAATALYQANDPVLPSTPAMQGGSMNAGGSSRMFSPFGMMGGGGGGQNAFYLIMAAEMPPGIGGTMRRNMQPANEILGVAADDSGVYFGTANSGSVFRWTPNGGAIELLKTPANAVYALKKGPQGSLYAATGEKGAIYQITPGQNGRESRAAKLLEPTQPQTLALAFSNGGNLLAATGNNAAAYQIGRKANADPAVQNAIEKLSDAPNAIEGTFTSNVFDAGQIVRWGALRAASEGNARLETRSGNIVEPDASWSAWQSVSPDGNQFKIASPAARYLQYRAFLTDQSRLARIEVLFRAPNRAPVVKLTLPVGGEAISGKKKLVWKGTDPDSDALRYKLWLSKAGGEWKLIELPSATEASFELDTTKYEDGTYRAKLEASDAARNPEDPQSDEVVGLPFTIDNTKPIVSAPVLEKVGDNWRLTASANDATSTLAGAEWRIAPEKKEAKKDDKKADAKKADSKTDKKTVKKKVEDEAKAETDDEKADDGEKTDEEKDEKKPENQWQAAAASDGLFDSQSENIVALLNSDLAGKELKAGTKIEFRVRDAAGNEGVVTLVLK